MPALTQQQLDHFLEKGFITLHDCFDPKIAREWVDLAFVRMGYDPKDPTTWKEKRIHLPVTRSADTREFAPKVWQAVCQLLGSEDRVVTPYHFADAFIMNLGIGTDQPWQGPGPTSPGWHKDGDFFLHFLDSPEQGLLTLVAWSDIEPRGGGTFIACDSVPIVARYLAEHPQGVRPEQFNFNAMVAQCSDFVEMTAKVGDVVLLHPFMLHAHSQNHRGTARVISNPPAHLKEPMNFNRPDPADFSPVEQAVLRGLGKPRYDFVPASPRQRIVPERVLREKKALEEQKARLAAAGLK